MYDVRNILARNNAIGRGAYASTTGAGVAEELFDEDGFSYKELLQEYSGNQNKSSKRQSDNNRNRQQDNNHSQSLNLRPYSKRNTASASELLNGLAVKNNAYIQTIGTAASLSNTKLSSSESNAKSEDMSTNKVVSEVDTLSPDSDVYFKNVTVLRSAPSEANRENWLAGYAGKATLVSTAEVDGVQWATIKIGSGKLAYVHADELSVTNPLVTATGSRDNKNVDIGTMLGVRNAVKLYKDMDEQSDYSGVYGDETGMEVLERTIKNGEEWLKVKTYSNDVGWCKAEQLCPLKEKLHTINNPSGDGYKLNLNVGTIPRSMIPSNLNIDADGNIECKISAAYLKNSINAHVFYDESGIAHGTRGAEAFDLSELDKTDIVGTAGFTPDGWVNFKLSDGRTITINMADLDTNIETGKTNNENNIKDLIINNRPDLFDPNWTILGPTEKGSLLEANEYSTTKAEFVGNASPVENGLDIVVPVKDNNGKEYNVPIKMNVTEYDDGYILSLDVSKDEMVDESGNKFKVDFDRGIRHTTSVSFDKEGNFDKQATQGYNLSINIRYGNSNDYQKIGLDFSKLNIVKGIKDFSVETDGKIRESVNLVDLPKGTMEQEEMLDEKIAIAQKKIEQIINERFDKDINKITVNGEKTSYHVDDGGYVAYIELEKDTKRDEILVEDVDINNRFFDSITIYMPFLNYGYVSVKNDTFITTESSDDVFVSDIYPVANGNLNITVAGADRPDVKSYTNIYGSDNNDNIFISESYNLKYYAGYGHNTIMINYSGAEVYATQGENDIHVRGHAKWPNDGHGMYIKSGGNNTFYIHGKNNTTEPTIIEDFSENDTIKLTSESSWNIFSLGDWNYYKLRAVYQSDGSIDLMHGTDRVVKLTGDIDLTGKVELTNRDGGHSYSVSLDKLISSAPLIDSVKIHLWKGDTYSDKTSETIVIAEDGDAYLSGYDVNGEKKITGVSCSGTVYIRAKDILASGTRFSGSVRYTGNSLSADDNVDITLIDSGMSLVTKGGENHIVVEGKDNIITTGKGKNELDIKGYNSKVNTYEGTNSIKVGAKETHINCGAGTDIITLKSTGTTISNFDFDMDKLNFASYSELEAKVQGRSIVVRGKDSNSEDFVVSLLGTTDIDKIQKIIEEHNENVQKDEMSRKLTESYDSLENSLAEKIGTAIKNDVEPVFEAKDALKQIDKIGKIEGNTHLPQNVIDRYKEYIAESMANSAITADDLTNTERIVNSWASIFGDNKEIPIGEYTIVPTSISYNGIGAFKADVKKDGKYVTTLYMANLDNKALSEAVTDFIAAGQKVYKSKLNEAIKSYVDEVGDAFGVNLGEAYDVGVGVINLLSGGDAGKSKFSEMLNSFGQKNVAKIIERTFGREGKNMIKAVRSLKDAKDNIDSAINTANLTDYEKITGLLNATAKLIGKL